PPEPFRFTVGGRDTEIQLRIGNTGPTPLSIRVRLEAERLSFPEGEIDVVLQPEDVTQVPVPVTARANGEFGVLVHLLTPAGNALGEPVELTARVNPLAGIGRVVTVGAVLVLLSWWYSWFRRRRQAELAAAIDGAVSRHPTGRANGGEAADGSDVRPDESANDGPVDTTNDGSDDESAGDGPGDATNADGSDDESADNGVRHRTSRRGPISRHTVSDTESADTPRHTVSDTERADTSNNDDTALEGGAAGGP